MNMKKLLGSVMSLVMAAAFAAGSCAYAADYPVKPITVISPYGAGGDSDIAARVWAEFAKQELGQPVLVVNKTGGGGLTGTMFASKARPDGYTLFLGQLGPCVMLPITTKAGGLNKDSFDMIARFATSNTGAVVNADTPWKTLKDFEKDAAANPQKYTFSSPSATSWVALAFKSWIYNNKLQMKNVEYVSGAEAATAVLGKHGDITFLFRANFDALVKGGKLKLLAVGDKMEEYPDVPTFAELGYEGNYMAWAAIAAPKGVPDDIKAKLQAVTEKIANNPEFIKALENVGYTINYLDGAAFKQEVDKQYVEMQTLLKAMNLAVQ